MKKFTNHPGRLPKLAWPIAAAVSLVPGLLSSPVFAQGTIEEIVVTAQRREQAIQDVPISITAFGAEDLQARNIENTENLDLLLPNVMIRGGGTTGPTQGNFTMRGVPGVARYLDGVAQTGTQGSLANLVELERIEVLKGPQGTLFGKNAMGGAISYVSRPPAEEFGARIRLNVGNFSQTQLTANIDIPLSDNFLSKISYFTSEKDGYVQSGISTVQHGDEDDTVIRFDGLWHASPDVDVRFVVDSIKRSPDHPNADVLYDVNEAQGMVKNYNKNGLIFTDESDAFGKREEYRNSSTFAGPGWRYNSLNYNMTIDWNINDTLSLRSITGGREYDSDALADLDASHYQFFEIYTAARVQEVSQEIQLLSDGDRLDWVLGIYSSDVEDTQRRFDWQFVEFAPRDTNWITENNTQDVALFAEATYEISEQLEVTVGGRYTEEEYAGGQWNAVEPIPTWPNTSYSFTKGTARNQAEANFYSFTPRLSVSYDWTDDIMAYATYSEGFNAGGVNTTPNPDGSYSSFTGETLKQFELGLRTMLLNDSLRLNLAYFDGTWEDMRVGEALVPGRIVQTNAGEAEIEGFEIDSLWAVSDNFSINASAGWLDTQYTELGTTTTIRLSSSFAFSPDFQASVGGQYDWHQPNGATMSYRLDYGWTSDYVTIQDIRLQKIQPQYGLLSGRMTYEPADADWSYALWGRNLTNEWYQQGGFGAFLGGVDQGVVARPREFGITLNMEF
jgi:iron complex outermembrane receptor protein